MRHGIYNGNRNASKIEELWNIPLRQGDELSIDLISEKKMEKQHRRDLISHVAYSKGLYPHTFEMAHVLLCAWLDAGSYSQRNTLKGLLDPIKFYKWERRKWEDYQVEATHACHCL